MIVLCYKFSAKQVILSLSLSLCKKKCRQASGVLCNHQVLIWLKGKKLDTSENDQAINSLEHRKRTAWAFTSTPNFKNHIDSDKSCSLCQLKKNLVKKWPIDDGSKNIWWCKKVTNWWRQWENWLRDENSNIWWLSKNI